MRAESVPGQKEFGESLSCSVGHLAQQVFPGQQAYTCRVPQRPVEKVGMTFISFSPMNVLPHLPRRVTPSSSLLQVWLFLILILLSFICSLSSNLQEQPLPTFLFSSNLYSDGTPRKRMQIPPLESRQQWKLNRKSRFERHHFGVRIDKTGL